MEHLQKHLSHIVFLPGGGSPGRRGVFHICSDPNATVLLGSICSAPCCVVSLSPADCHYLAACRSLSCCCLFCGTADLDSSRFVPARAWGDLIQATHSQWLGTVACTAANSLWTINSCHSSPSLAEQPLERVFPCYGLSANPPPRDWPDQGVVQYTEYGPDAHPWLLFFLAEQTSFSLSELTFP